MIRFILQLLGKKYEPCKNCELLKEVLEYEREEKRELQTTLLSLVKPQVIIQPEVELKPMTPRHTMWSRRRAEIEKADRQAAALKVNSPVVGKPDAVDNKPSTVDESITKQLEMELGIIPSEDLEVH